MSVLILDGKALAAEIQESIKTRVAGLAPRLGRKPGLAVVLVGENPASKVYVGAKTKAAINCGLEVTDVKLPATVSNAELQSQLKQLSKNPAVDGILLQLPLPNGLDEFAALCCIEPPLDADGLHPLNQGLLLRGAPAPRSCTPMGCMALIEKACASLGRSTKLAGLHAVVVGRSILVGKPIALLLLEQNCTVTMCHSRTKDLAAEVRRADIVVAAVGQPQMVKGDWIKPGAIVIDVGINRLDDGKLVGDVDFESAKKTSGAITPVPGGVGPLTITMLISNTVDAAELKARC